MTFIKERKSELRELSEKKMSSKLEADLADAIAEFKSKYSSDNQELSVLSRRGNW